ncbi:Putative F-box/LRR-repeat protein At5g02930 [Linum perenne]
MKTRGELVRLRVSGLELVTLSLLRVDVSQLELSAPKLQSFELRFFRLLQFSELSVPSLVHADIQSHWRDSYNEDLDREHLVFMFRGLRSVESLTLCRKITQVFSKISKFLEQQPCPFTKLKNLSLEFYSSDDIPHKVLHDYFLNGSSNASLNIQIRDGWVLGAMNKEEKNMNNGSNSSSQLWIPGIDRISSLPESILHHILSFLDTRSAIKTSLLSKQWKSAWKHVHTLNLNLHCSEFSKDERFAENVLFLRYPLHLSKVLLNIGKLRCRHGDAEYSLLRRVVEYAVSHGAQEFHIRLNCIHMPFLELFDSISDTVTTLELSRFPLYRRLEFSRFRLLTTLELRNCWFLTNEELVEPFSKFPCLENLVMDECSWEHEVEGRPVKLRVSGLELVRLSLLRIYVTKLELSAPKLISFRLQFVGLLQFSELSLPSLVHADIQCYWGNCYEEEDDLGKEQLIFMFRGLGSVFSKISRFLEQQPCPFTKLKNLNLEFDSIDDIPHKVLNDYFLKGSSNCNLNIRIREGDSNDQSACSSLLSLE